MICPPSPTATAKSPHSRPSTPEETKKEQNSDFQTKSKSLPVALENGNAPEKISSSVSSDLDDSQRIVASMESLGSLNNSDVEVVVNTVVATAAPSTSSTPTCNSFGRRASRRSSRYNKNKQHPQSQAVEQKFQLPPLPASSFQPALTREQSWQINDWEEMFSSTNSGNNSECNASQNSMYHLLDELEEEGSRDGDWNAEDSKDEISVVQGGKGDHHRSSANAFRRSVHDMILDDEDTPDFFNTSGSTNNLTGSIITSSSGLAGIVVEGRSGKSNNDLEHVFGDLLLD